MLPPPRPCRDKDVNEHDDVGQTVHQEVPVGQIAFVRIVEDGPVEQGEEEFSRRGDGAHHPGGAVKVGHAMEVKKCLLVNALGSELPMIARRFAIID